VEFDVDWNRQVLSGAIRTLLYPDSAISNYRVVSLGDREAIADFRNVKSYAHQVATTLCPETMRKIDNMTAYPTLDNSVALSRALVQVEENTNPDEVGGAIKTVMWLQNGQVEEWMGSDANLPKTTGPTNPRK